MQFDKEVHERQLEINELHSRQEVAVERKAVGEHAVQMRELFAS